MSLSQPILAFDTAAQQCAVALLSGDLSLERTEPQTQGQSQRLLPLIQDILHEGGLGFGDLAAVAVTTGPGSFTGVRIALAAAQGIALARNIPAIGIDSFAAFNASLEPGMETMRAVIVESRRVELYWCVMTLAGEAVSKPANSLPTEIAAYLANRPALLCGDAAAKIAALLPDRAMIDQTPGPSPLAIARLGLARLAQGGAYGLPTPLYIRPPDAKIAGDRV